MNDARPFADKQTWLQELSLVNELTVIYGVLCIKNWFTMPGFVTLSESEGSECNSLARPFATLRVTNKHGCRNWAWELS